MSNAAEPSDLHREVVRAEFMTYMLAFDHATDATSWTPTTGRC